MSSSNKAYRIRQAFVHSQPQQSHRRQHVTLSSSLTRSSDPAKAGSQKGKPEKFSIYQPNTRKMKVA